MARQIQLILRGGVWQLKRRVPVRYQRIEPRKVVWVSLHTDSETVARSKALTLWNELVQGWEARLAGDSKDAEQRFAAARELAETRGFRFLPAKRVAELPAEELLARVDAIPVRNGKPDLVVAAAVLGGATPPPITITRALDLYWTLAADKTFGKSEDQVRRWRNPRKKAITSLVEIIGDKPLREITAEDMLDFREWWMERILAEGLTPNSANKDLIHIGDVLKTVNKMKRLQLVLPLGDLSFKEGERDARPPFSVDWIRTRLLADGALAGLNTEARCILLGMVNTGYRPSEGAGLMPHHIHLDTNVPHISIEPEGRQLKSPRARRRIPLVGVSLEAFRACPQGFPRYRNSPSLSDTVNKYLRENGLLQTPEHSLYSLRDSFEDRMLAARVDDRISRDLFGHRLSREKYGDGASLEHLAEVVQSFAL